MRKKLLTMAALAVFVATAPAVAQEESTPAPSSEQQPAAKTEATQEAPRDAGKKAEPAGHARRVSHHYYGWHVWPWTWVWYQLRYPFYYHHHHT
jgi:hypothetical protein